MLFVIGVLLALVPFWYILKEVIEVSQNYKNTVHTMHYVERQVQAFSIGRLLVLGLGLVLLWEMTENEELKGAKQ